MAGNIKGITIEIGGDTTKLGNALNQASKESTSLQKELKQVDNLLKFNPDNIDLISQKQSILAQNIQVTAQRLDTLKNAQAQVNQQFERGDISGEQYRAFQREIVATESKLNNFKKTLAEVDTGNSLAKVSSGFKDVKKEADNAEKSAKGLSDTIATTVGGLAAGGGIAGVISSSLSAADLQTKIDIVFDVPESSKKSVQEAIKGVSSYGVDAEEALEGVRRQWALNKDASDESNAAVVKGASAIATSYAGIDFTELIQETNEISGALGISNEEALGLVNSLLKTGFPPEQLDIISEYGQQLADAGFSAEEVQNLFSAGVDTSTWNIDNLLDGLKEGRIRLVEFGDEVPESVGKLLDGTDISIGQLQDWGKAIAKGGDEGSVAFLEVAKALSQVEDDTQRNTLGVELFGTMWEDQGKNITDTIINAADGTADLAEGTEQLADDVAKIDDSPAVRLRDAFNKMMEVLQPLLLGVADLIGKFATFAQENPVLVATIAGIVTVIGTLIGIMLVLAPILTAITGLAGALGVSVGAIVLPIVAVIAIIAALIAIGVLLYRNWDEILAKSKEVWNNITTAISVAVGIAKEYVLTTWASIKESLLAAWNLISSTASTVWTTITNAISTTVQTVSSTVIGIWNTIRSTLTTTWNTIYSTVSGVFNNIKTTVTTITNSISSTVTSIWNTIRGAVSTTVNTIYSTVTGIFTSMYSAISTTFNSVYTTITTIWGTVQGFFEGIDLFSIGANIINGLIGGIGSVAETLFKKVTSIASTIKGAFTDALDIHSPSRVFRGYGKNINEGLILGLEDTTPALDRELDSLYGGFAANAERLLYQGSGGVTTSNINNSRTFTPNINISAGAGARGIAAANAKALRRLSYEF